MARFNKLSVGRLLVDEIVPRYDSTKPKYVITNASVIAGENASATLAEATRLPVDNSALAFLGFSTNGTPSYSVTAAFDELGAVNGLNIGNMATTDRINVMAVKQGVQRFGVVTAGTATTVAGQTTHAVTFAGVLATDMAFGMMRVQGTGARIVLKLVCTANTITMTSSGANTAAHTFDYVVIRELGSFQPSHEIFTAGSAALVSLGAGTTDTIAIAGLSSSDIVLAQCTTMTEVDHYMVAAVPTAGTLTMTFSGAPGESVIHYVVFRAVDKND